MQGSAKGKPVLHDIPAASMHWNDVSCLDLESARCVSQTHSGKCASGLIGFQNAAAKKVGTNSDFPRLQFTGV